MHLHVCLKDKLIKQIHASGAITVAEFMRQCIAHYYATRDPFGANGDFTTSPEISQIFGELIGAWLATTWAQLGKPRATLCELGPGRGTLMKDILRVTKPVEGFHDAIDVLLVETSPVLKTLQEKTLQGAHPCIAWQNEANSFSPRPLLLVANEFFDALPIEQYVQASSSTSPKGEQLRLVDIQDGVFIFTPCGKVSRETSPASSNIISAVASHIYANGGAALLVDYGYEGGEQTDTLQAVKHHGFVHPLSDPGEADLTAHVDFAAVKEAAQAQGAWVFGTVEQGIFLQRLGAELRAAALCKNALPETRQNILEGLKRLIAPEQMGRLFKVTAITSFSDAPAGF